VRCHALRRCAAGGEAAPPALEWETRVGSAALLTLDLHPDAGCAPEAPALRPTQQPASATATPRQTPPRLSRTQASPTDQPGSAPALRHTVPFPRCCAAARRAGIPLVAVGGMDGRLSLLDTRDGQLLASATPHSKYLLRVAWSGALAPPSGGAGPQGEAREPGGPGGDPGLCAAVHLLATASTDESVGLHRVSVEAAGGEGGSEGAGGAGVGAPRLVVRVETLRTVRRGRQLAATCLCFVTGGSPAARACPHVSVRRVGPDVCWAGAQVAYASAVADAVFLPDGASLLVAVRGSCWLRVLDTRPLAQVRPRPRSASTGAQPPSSGAARARATHEPQPRLLPDSVVLGALCWCPGGQCWRMGS
jgi:hypothetical protein